MVTSNSKWYRTGTAGFTGVWTKTDLPAREPDGGIGYVEWLNLATGAALLLACDGQWRTGGKFRLFYKRPGSDVAVETDELLWPVQHSFGIDSSEWSVVQTRCVRYIDALVDISDDKTIGDVL